MKRRLCPQLQFDAPVKWKAIPNGCAVRLTAGAREPRNAEGTIRVCRVEVKLFLPKQRWRRVLPQHWGAFKRSGRRFATSVRRRFRSAGIEMRDRTGRGVIHAGSGRRPARRRAGLRQFVEGMGAQHADDRHHSAQQCDSIDGRNFCFFRQLGKVRHVSLRGWPEDLCPGQRKRSLNTYG